MKKTSILWPKGRRTELIIAWLVASLLATPFLFNITFPLYQLEIEIEAQHPDRMELYWDRGQGYQAEEVSVSRIYGNLRREVHQFRVPPGKLNSVRLDPGSGQSVKISRITLRKEYGSDHEQEFRLELSQIAALHQIAQLRVEENVLHVTSEDAANDPQLLLRSPEFSPGGWGGYEWEYSVQWAGILVVIGWMVGVYVIGRWPIVYFAPARTPLPESRNLRRRIALWIVLPVVAVSVVFAAKSLLSHAGIWKENGGFTDVFRIQMKVDSELATISQLFYDTGKGFNEAESRIVELGEQRDPAQPVEVVFYLPSQNIRAFRWDPINAAGKLQIQQITFEEAGKERPLTIHRLLEIYDIEPWEREQGAWIELGKVAGDPAFAIHEYSVGKPHAMTHWWILLQLAGVLSVAMLGFVVLWVWDRPHRDQGQGLE